MAKFKNSFSQQICSFCGQPAGKTRHLVAGPDGICICDQCVAVCQTILDEEKTELSPIELTEVPSPKEFGPIRCRARLCKKSPCRCGIQPLQTHVAKSAGTR